MDFLKNYGFKSEDIEEFMNNTPKKMLDTIKKHEALVTENIKYIKDLGTSVYKEIFINYPDMFLMDASNFSEMFSKYETDELIERLNNNFKLVEYL